MKKLLLRFNRLCLNAKLKVFIFSMVIPFMLLITYLIVTLVSVCNSYNTIVKNITVANAYNLNFKKEVDYALYRMIAGSVTAEELYGETGLQNPYEILEEATGTLDNLAGRTTGTGNEKRIEKIHRLMVTLQKRISEINENIMDKGHYDDNIYLLETNIYILTELIQNQVQEYIYYEAGNLETVREQLEVREKVALQISLAAFGLMVVFALMMSWVISKSVSKPIEELCRQTEQVAKGNFEAIADSENGDEIATLTRSFNSMVGRIGELVRNIKREQSNLRKTELRLLQAQINPHFLYNTLDTIVWLAEGNQSKKVVAMVNALSEFFRTTLSDGRDIITIEEEKNHISSYLQIQQSRYSDILEYEIDIPTELYGISIVKLTLQPLVENALYHGIKNKRGLGRIRVSAWREGAVVILAVEDNGIGMNEENLLKIRNKLSVKEGAAQEQDGFGIGNVNERLKLTFGEEYGLWLDSRYGEGSIFKVRIPARAVIKQAG